MQAQPATKTSELLGEIANLSSAGRKNAILLKSLERRAREVLRIDAKGGNTLLGALAAVRQDLEGLRTYHDRAVAQAPHEAVNYRNYAVSLAKAGAIDDAAAMAMRAWELDKAQIHFVLLIQFTCQSGRLREAATYLQLNSERYDDFVGAHYAGAQQLLTVASFLAERDISDATASAMTRLAFQLAPAPSVKGVISNVAADDETKWVDFAFTVDEDTEEVGELNLKLAERMAEFTLDESLGRASSALVVRFTQSTNASNPA